MDDDLQPAEGELVAWIAERWAPEPGDLEAFLEGLAKRRHRRRVRNDAMGIVALAAAALLFLGSAPMPVPGQGWLAATSLGEPSSPTLPADLAALRQTFLAGTTP